MEGAFYSGTPADHKNESMEKIKALEHSHSKAIVVPLGWDPVGPSAGVVEMCAIMHAARFFFLGYVSALNLSGTKKLQRFSFQ